MGGTPAGPVSLVPEQIPWEVRGEDVKVDGRPLDPRGVVYSPRHRALLVCDGRNVQIVVMEPESGKVWETVQFDRREIEGIADLYLCGDKAVMLQVGNG